MNLRIHRLTVAEIDHEVDFYESRQGGLGTEQEDEIDAAFSLILRFPQAAPQWRDRLVGPTNDEAGTRKIGAAR